MKKRNMLFIVIGAFTILALAGTAFAANEIFLKRDIPPVPRSDCEKAGNLSMEFAPDSIMSENDVIIYTLSNDVTVCKDIDFFLRLTGTAVRQADGSDWDDPLNPINGFQILRESSADYPVVVTDDVEDVISIFDTNYPFDYASQPADGAPEFAQYGVLYELGYLVRAVAGSRTITFKVARRAIANGYDTDLQDDVVYGQVYNVNDDVARLAVYFGWYFGTGDANDRMTVRLWDSKFSGYKTDNSDTYFEEYDATTNAINYPGFTQCPDDTNRYCGSALGFFLERPDDDSSPYYRWLTEPDDNVLCINVENFTGEFVEATPDDNPIDPQFALTFSDDHRIARIEGAINYQLQVICKPDCYEIPVGAGLQGQGGGVTSFDPGDYMYTDNDIFTGSTGYCFPKGNELGIGYLIYNSVAGETLPVGQELVLTMELRVNGLPATGMAWWADVDGDNYPDAVDALYWADNNVACNSTMLDQAGIDAPFDYIDGLSTVSGRFTLGQGSDAVNGIVIDVGTIGIDPEDFNANDQISIIFTLSKYPCGQLFTGEECVATTVETCPDEDADTAGARTLVFPYVTGFNSATWWCGIVLDNMSATGGTATLNFYDATGGTGTYTTDAIPAHGQSVFALSSIMGQVTGDIDPNASMYVVVETEFDADGLMLIGTGDNTRLHGYLPRK